MNKFFIIFQYRLQKTRGTKEKCCRCFREMLNRIEGTVINYGTCSGLPTEYRTLGIWVGGGPCLLI